MLTAKDAKNSQNASYVIAGTVVINFMILVLVLGPESTGFDPTWGPVSSVSYTHLTLPTIFRV